MIHEKRPDAGPADVKVPLPVDLHIRLHVLKIREGRRIADVVCQALDEYFVRLQAQGPGARRPPPP